MIKLAKFYFYEAWLSLKGSIAGILLILSLGILFIDSAFYNESCVSVDLGKFRLKEYGSGASYLVADIQDQGEIATLKFRKTAIPESTTMNVFKRESYIFGRISYEVPFANSCRVSGK